MEPFKPPTDNLYKFIAIAGLVLSLGCVWQMNKLHSYAYETMERYDSVRNSQMRRRAGDKLSVYPSLIVKDKWPKHPSFDEVEARDDARRTYMEYADSLGELLYEESATPTEKSKSEYFSREDVKSFFKIEKGIEREKYDSFVSQMTVSEFAELVRPEIESARQERADLVQELDLLRDTWRAIDWFYLAFRWAGLLAWVGGGVSVIGFIAWYVQVQRWEDQLLKARAKVELAKTP
jgi:hypothetical protein